MARLNNLMKFFLWIVNSVLGLIGIIVLALSLYVVFADWGGLSISFFLGLGIANALMGVSIIYISKLGEFCVDYQNVKEGTWTGKRLIFLYLLCVIGGLVLTIFFAMYLTNESTSLDHSRNILLEGGTIEYDDFEVAVSEKFNEFYFGVVETCDQLNLVWFWDFVHTNCPSSMDEDLCAKCTENWITTCVVDENACYASYDVTVEGGGVQGVPHSTCPYDKCRVGMLGYFIDQMEVFLVIVLTVLCLFAWLVIFATFLICFHERDSNELYLMKAGAIRRKKSKRDEERSKEREKKRNTPKGSTPKGSTPKGSTPKTISAPKQSQPVAKASSTPTAASAYKPKMVQARTKK